MNTSNSIKQTSVQLKGDRAKAFFNSIDFTPLYDYVQSYYGIEPDVECFLDTKDVPHIKWKQNVKDLCGIFGNATESVHLQVFSVGLLVPYTYDAMKKHNFMRDWNFDFTDKDIDGEYGEPYFWATFDLRYNLKIGGSNGVSLFRAHYSKSKGWEFQEAENPW